MALIQRGSNVSVSVSTNEESILQDGLAHNSDIHQNRVQSYMFLVKWTNVCAHRIGLIKYFLALSQGFNYFLTGILRMLTSETGSSGRRYPMPCRGQAIKEKAGKSLESKLSDGFVGLDIRCPAAGRPICRIRYPKRLPRAGVQIKSWEIT